MNLSSLPSEPRTGSRPWRLILATAVAVALVAGSCSSDDEASSTTSAPASSAAASDVEPIEATFEVPEERMEEIDAAGLTFTEVSYATQPDDVPWPTEEWPTGDIPDDVDAAEVQGLVDRAFGELSDDTGTIDAILVVRDGVLVVEEYNAWDPDTVHNSWSMAKSINSALVGILVGEGRLDPWAPVAAPEWSEPDDDRAAITLDELLRMSSGLEWDESYTDPEGDVLSTLPPDNDRANYTASKPLEAEVGTYFEYSSGTANLLARSVAEEVGFGDELVAWIDTSLLQPLGITQVEHLVDIAGVISGGSWINLTPRDFARFGLLYARDGIWEDERLLPQGWVDYSRMPTPTDPEGTYGAQWWLETEPERPGVFGARGFDGQNLTVAPDQDLVVVVLSSAGDDREEPIRQGLLDAFGA